MKRAHRRLLGWVLIPLGVASIATAVVTPAGAAAVPGSQGTDTALPLTESAMTVNGRDQFADLAITVNQTRNLNNQAISITWTGGAPTIQGPGRFGGNYLQIMQCWGDDDGAVPGNPGPPPEQCVMGAVGGTYEGLPFGVAPNGNASTRIISNEGWENFDTADGYVDPHTGALWRRFRSVNGTVVDAMADSTFSPSFPGDYWLNPYFDNVTTNEIPGAVTSPDGHGAELFQVDTGVESAGLGCGKMSQPVEGGDRKIPQCWIVVVPRGTPGDEDAGTPYSASADTYGVATSPLSDSVWQNRIAIPIEFNPVDSSCSLADQERRIAGNELLLPAISSWQPALCSMSDLPPYSYAPVSDSGARQQLSTAAPGSPGLIAVSSPLTGAAVSASNPIVYAPLAASGVVIGFNAERFAGASAPAEEQALSGVRIADINLTPRLVAKLLTQSYRTQVTVVEPPSYEWMQANPSHLGVDPDFLQFNPEFELLLITNPRGFSGLQLPAGNSDAATQLWKWVFADPEAKAWLDGSPDEWGMRVNPLYSSNASINPTGLAFGSPAPGGFPKSDPYCYQAPQTTPQSPVPPPLCGTDWMPYTRGLGESAQIARAAADRARVVFNPFAVAPSDVWKRESPQLLGRRSILALTDTASAARFGVQMARLSRAGDDGADRDFVAPDAASLLAGISAMRPGAESSVLEPDPSIAAPGAYPLTMLTYAATAPLKLDTVARSEYAAFIEYAAGAGQVAGLDLGELPRGYTPLPEALRQQALDAAATVRTLQPAPTTTTTTTPPTTTTTTTTTTLPPHNPPSGNNNSSNNTNTQSPRTNTTTSSTSTTTTSVASAPIATDLPSTPPTSAPPPTTEAAVVVDTIQPPPPTTIAAPTGTTPETGVGVMRFALAGFGGLSLFAALIALEITKRPRFALFDPDVQPGLDDQQAEI